MAKFNSQQQIVLAILPKISTVLSILGSGWIVIECLKDRRKLNLTYHRLMFIMSIGDIFRSAVQFLTTWPMPKNTSGVYGAVGTTQTCTAQGFIFQAGLLFILYNAYLAIYYVMVLRLELNERTIRQFEWCAFVFTICLSLGTSIAGLILKLYNAANLWCWIAPLNCQEPQNRSCERGEHSWIFRYAFWYVWLWLSLLTVFICMTIIVITVTKQERRVSTRQGKLSDPGRVMKKCRQVATGQAMYYCITFLLMGLFGTLTRVIQQQINQTFFEIILCMAFFSPLNGFWSGIIYLRPRYIGFKQNHPEWSIGQLIGNVLGRIKDGDNNCSDSDHELGVLLTINNNNNNVTDEEQQQEEEQNIQLEDQNRNNQSQSSSRRTTSNEAGSSGISTTNDQQQLDGILVPANIDTISEGMFIVSSSSFNLIQVTDKGGDDSDGDGSSSNGGDTSGNDQNHACNISNSSSSTPLNDHHNTTNYIEDDAFPDL